MNHRRLILVYILFFLTTSQISASNSTTDDSFKSKIDSVALEVLNETKAPSASIAIVMDGKIVYTQAYGYASLNPKRTAKTDMKYAIGSISKQFTAATILLLEQEGKLSINDPVSKWLPDLTQANDVTIKETSFTYFRLSGFLAARLCTPYDAGINAASRNFKSLG